MAKPNELHLPDSPGSGSPEPEHWFEKVFLIYVREPLLRPVLFVLVAHVVAFTAPMLLSALRDRRGLALGALGLLLIGTGSAVRGELQRRGGRPGAMTGLLAALWVLTAAGAWTADYYGIY